MTALRGAIAMYEVHLEDDEHNLAALAVVRRAWAKVYAWDQSFVRG